jgi:hypothetical protein
MADEVCESTEISFGDVLNDIIKTIVTDDR